MKGKYIVPLILASVTATTFGAHAQFSVNADYSESTKLEGDLISVSRFQGEGEVNEPVYLPEATASSGEAVSIVVIDPRGNKITPSVDVTSGKKFFVPTLKGYYTVKYTSTAVNNLETVSEELKVLVSGSEYTITLPKNSSNVIPATIKTGTEIKIPLPTVKEDDEEIAEAEVISGLEVTVTNKDDGTSTQALTYSSTSKTYNFTAPKAGVYEIIYRYRKGNYVQDFKTDSFVVKDNFDSSKMNLNFSYKSSKPTTAVLGVEQKLPEVKVFDKNNSSVEVDSFVSITVKHIETGTVFEVKDYKFTPTLKGDYKVTYKASIPLFGLETQENTFIIQNVKDNKNPEFTVSNNYEKTTVDGKTTVTKVYNDANKNNVADSGEVLYDAANYTTADDEEKEEAITKALGNTLYNIPSVVVLNAEGKATIDIPAFYGTDNFDDQSKLTYARHIKNESGLLTEIKKANPDGTREKYPENEWAQHTFTAPGTYYIRYSVEDEAGNYYQDSYPITVLSANTTLLEHDEYMLPTLEFPAISSYVKTNGTLLINQPSATDKHDDRVETRVYYSFDKDFAIETAKEITELNEDGQYELNIADAIDALNPASPTKIYVHAIAYNDYAVTTGSGTTTRLYSKLTREVTLINSTEDDKPVFVTAEAGTFIDNLAAENDIVDGIDNFGMNSVSGKAAFKQKDLVKLPAFVITDISDTNLNISLTVRDPYGKVITVKNSSYEKQVTFNGAGEVTLNTYTVQGGSFVADYSGVYTITYTAKDAAGNLTSKTYGVRVQDTEKPNIILSSYAPFTSSVEVGKFIEIPAATLKDKGEILTEVTTNVSPDNKKVDPSNPTKYIPGTYWRLIEGPSHNVKGTVGFTPTIAGEYVIEYYGWDAEGNETKSKRYTITAADTIKPTVTLEKDYILNDVAWDEEKGQVTVYAPGVVELYDGYRDAKNPENDYDQTPVSDITLTVKVYDKNNNEIDSVVATEYEIDNQGNPVLTGGGDKKYFVIGNDGVNDTYATRYRFIAQKQGTYTIKYIATDANGKSEEITRTVNVGDTKAPEVEWNDSEEDLITTANIGDYYEFNVDMITLDGIKTSDAIEAPSTSDDADYSITVNMYDPSSSIVSNEYKNDESKENSYRWKFEKSGTYELRIVVQDKAGNKETKSYNIVVAEDETETETVKPVVGTVLIIISSLLLVGVVAYFVVTSQIKNKGKKGPKAKSKK